MAGPGMADSGTAEPQLGIAMADLAMAGPGTAELQLGILPVNNFPTTLESKRRPGQGCHLQNDAL